MEKNKVERVENKQDLRRALCALWDTLIDAQDQIATTISLLNCPDPATMQGKAFLVTPDRPPEVIDLAEYRARMAVQE